MTFRGFLLALGLLLLVALAVLFFYVLPTVQAEAVASRHGAARV